MVVITLLHFCAGFLYACQVLRLEYPGNNYASKSVALNIIPKEIDNYRYMLGVN
jgi:hypothetical protein